MYVPDKRQPRSPLKKSTRFSTPSDEEVEDSEEEDAEDDSFKEDPAKRFYCRYAVDSRRGLFYALDYDRHRRTTLTRSNPPKDESGPSSGKSDAYNWGEGDIWDVEGGRGPKAPSGTSASKPKPKPKAGTAKYRQEDDGSDASESDGSASDQYDNKYQEFDSEDEKVGDEDQSEAEEEHDEQDYEDDDELSTLGEPRTPSKKRKGAGLATPRRNKRNKTFVQPTPHSKAALARRNKSINESPRKRKATLTFRFPEPSLTFQASMAHLPKDPWLRSMHALHVGSRPDILPCRDGEYDEVMRNVSQLLEEGSGGCICMYITLS